MTVDLLHSDQTSHNRGVEYGVRATLSGNTEPVEWAIGTDEILARQRIAELLDEGARDVEALSRPRPGWTAAPDVTARVYAERNREAILSIAQRAWEEFGDSVAGLLADTCWARRNVRHQVHVRQIEAAARVALRSMLAGPLAETAQHSRLGDDDRLERLVHLMGELTHQERVESGDHDTALDGPGEDQAALLADAERRVRDAADALYGGAR